MVMLFSSSHFRILCSAMSVSSEMFGSTVYLCPPFLRSKMLPSLFFFRSLAFGWVSIEGRGEDDREFFFRRKREGLTFSWAGCMRLEK